MVLEIRLIPQKEFQRIRKIPMDEYDKLYLLADMCRANALATVKRAGSGHLGSSFSSLDIVTFLYYRYLNTAELGFSHPDRDIYFSSKGHDVPGHYAVLFSLGIIPSDQFAGLRRLGGTHGHPDVSVPGIEANSGSLGMGISKAKGMALAKGFNGRKGRVLVMTGDGELQEGQIWESLQTTAHQKISNLRVIVDFNKIQTDRQVEEVIDLQSLEKKFELFGWHVLRCDGHDFVRLDEAFRQMDRVPDKPKILIADTIKGKGVSFMEGPQALKDNDGLYRWHAGAPDDDAFEAGYEEIVSRVNARLAAAQREPLRTEVIDTLEKHRIRLKDVAEKVVDAYGRALVELGGTRKDLVVLDADLAADCGLRPFEKAFPGRFIENGIAEQDMVSMAGGLALQGLLPVVNSFGVFLASRANEQIYNNATEKTKIVYICHYAGLIPAGPGKSHQSLRDISLFGALTDFAIMEPCNADETKQALAWCVNDATRSCMMRLAISPSPRTIRLPDDYRFTPGRGIELMPGGDAVIFAYGPAMLHEALTASEILRDHHGFGLKVINLPWLNRIDAEWLEETARDCRTLFALDNHSLYGGLGDALLNAAMASDALRNRRIIKFGIEDDPACGTPKEVLAYHGLDGRSLTARVLETVESGST